MLLVEGLQAITGQSYTNLVHERIVAALGLSKTRVVETLADLAPLAPGPSESLALAGGPVDARDHYHPDWVSHRLIASTPSDLARLLLSLFRGDLVGRDSLRAMTLPVSAPGGPPVWRKPSYGLGLMGDPSSPWGSVWGHGGAGPGYSACALHLSSSRGGALAACALCSTEQQTLPWDLLFELFDGLGKRIDSEG